MHEQATIRDLVATVLEVAHENDAKRVVRIKVHLGALSHFTPEHFVEHWQDASGGTIADWVAEVRDWCHDGERLTPPRRGITQTEVETCRELARQIVTQRQGRGRRPSPDALFHLLLCLRRLAVTGD